MIKVLIADDDIEYVNDYEKIFNHKNEGSGKLLQTKKNNEKKSLKMANGNKGKRKKDKEKEKEKGKEMNEFNNKNYPCTPCHNNMSEFNKATFTNIFNKNINTQTTLNNEKQNKFFLSPKKDKKRKRNSMSVAKDIDSIDALNLLKIIELKKESNNTNTKSQKLQRSEKKSQANEDNDKISEEESSKEISITKAKRNSVIQEINTPMDEKSDEKSKNKNDLESIVSVKKKNYGNKLEIKNCAENFTFFANQSRIKNKRKMI